MNTIGRLLIATQDVERARRIATLFEHARYDVETHAEAGAALAALTANPPDVILIGDRLADCDAPQFLRDVQRRADAADTPVAVDTLQPDFWREAKHDDYRIDDILPDDFDPSAMVFRLQPLFRLSTMQTELRLRSHDGAAAPACCPRTGGSQWASHGLYLALNPAANLPKGFLAGDAIWETASSLEEAETIVTGPGMFDLAVIDATSDRLAELAAFCRDMRDNPRLFNLPFLVRMPTAVPDQVRSLYRSGANRVLLGTVENDILAYEARVLIHLQCRRNAVREALRRTLDDATGYPRQAVYTAAFLRPYLKSRLGYAADRNRALSVVHIHLPEIASLAEEAGQGACESLTEQIGRWLSRLVRVEDLAVRLNGSDFAVVLPDTLASEAQFVMNRIAGVLTFTDFAVPDIYRPVKVWPLIGVAGMEPVDSVEHILQRACANLT